MIQTLTQDEGNRVRIYTDTTEPYLVVEFKSQCIVKRALYQNLVSGCDYWVINIVLTDYSVDPLSGEVDLSQGNWNYNVYAHDSMDLDIDFDDLIDSGVFKVTGESCAEEHNFVYLIDDDGNYLIDDQGNYLIDG